MIPLKTTLVEAIEQLHHEPAGKHFTQLMQHGTMQLEYFAPKLKDTQAPHLQDELYIITSGSATFNRNGDKVSCKVSDVLFVPAGMEHRFEEFSDDFATWVIFYGPNSIAG